MDKLKSIAIKHKKAAVATIVSVVVVAAGLVAATSLYTINESPDYQTVTPYSKSQSEPIEWKRVSPPGKDPVFAYTDTLEGVPISVSQQPLPESFLVNTDEQVAELAREFNATSKIDAFGTPVYVGVSAKGPQSVIFAKEGLLVMIKSQQKVSDQAWAEYIQSLVASQPD